MEETKEQEEKQWHPAEDGGEHPKEASLWLPLPSGTFERNRC